MSAARLASPPMRTVPLEAPDDVAGWRAQARAALAENVPPECIAWHIAGEEQASLFGDPPAPCAPATRPRPALRIDRALLTLVETALLHRDSARFETAYRLLWRLRETPWAARDPADADLIRLRAFAKAVRRDVHKMHAFVRFRKIGESGGGREQFAAWFEPEHHITRAVAGFFRDRFRGMDWLIVTPEASIRWDGTQLSTGPGGTRADVPAQDAIEAEWRGYYASIFNPARLKVAAMKREMPMKYWRNLPEASLIAGLIEDAGERTRAMVDNQPEMDLFGGLTPAAPAASARRFATLAEWEAALRAEDQPPPGFSDRLVFGTGDPAARLMLVGEQPGDSEDRDGRPFVGPAGQLLDEALREAGIQRERSWLTNAVKRFKYQQRGPRRIHQTPTAGDIAHYRWWLEEEVRLVDPVLIVALGSTALHALTGRKQALGPVRGAMQDWRDGRRLLVTVHPSFLLRLPDEQGRAIEYRRFVRELAQAQAALSAG